MEVQNIVQEVVIKTIPMKKKCNRAKWWSEEASGSIMPWQIDGETLETVTDFIFLGSKITADGDCSHEIKRRLLLVRKSMTNLDSILKSKDITLLTNVCTVKAMVFSSSHVWMWKLDYKESWPLKNWCFWIVVLEKTLESPSDCKEIQPVHPKGNKYWIFIRRTDAEAENPILWPLDVKNWLIGKHPDAGKDWRLEEKGMTEDEMVGWHHRLNGCEFERALGVGDGQGGLVCCSWCDHRELYKTEQMNGTEHFKIGSSRITSYFNMLKTEETGGWIVVWELYTCNSNLFCKKFH